MIEQIYNMLKCGDIMSCDKIAEKLGCTREMVLSMLDYMQEKSIIKKEVMGSTECSGSCSQCSQCYNQQNIGNKIFVYSIK